MKNLHRIVTLLALLLSLLLVGTIQNQNQTIRSQQLVLRDLLRDSFSLVQCRVAAISKSNVHGK